MLAPGVFRRLRRRGDFGTCGAGSGSFAAYGGELLSECPERSQRGTRGGRRGTEPAAPALPQCRPPPGPPFYGGRQLGGMAGQRKGAGGVRIDVASPTAAAAWVDFPAWWFRRLRARLWHGGAQVARWLKVGTCGAGLGVFRRCGGDLLCPLRQSRQNAVGDAADGLRLRSAASRSIGPPPYPLCRFATSPPDRGSRPRSPCYGGILLIPGGAVPARGNSSGWFQSPPGHWALMR